MISSILENPEFKITQFNEQGLHYNIVANEIYNVRSQIGNPFDKLFLPYIIAGLVSFDIGRMMGRNKYSLNRNSFASRLNSKLQKVRPYLEPLLAYNLLSSDLEGYDSKVKEAYNILSNGAIGGLHEYQKSFHVGATKIMHFLHPELFIIIDSNAARAFRSAWDIPFLKSAQPGYSPELYTECMKRVKKDISEYGIDKFRALEPNTPLTRIYDKLTFITGSK